MGVKGIFYYSLYMRGHEPLPCKVLCSLPVRVRIGCLCHTWHAIGSSYQLGSAPRGKSFSLQSTWKVSQGWLNSLIYLLSYCSLRSNIIKLYKEGFPSLLSVVFLKRNFTVWKTQMFAQLKLGSQTAVQHGLGSSLRKQKAQTSCCYPCFSVVFKQRPCFSYSPPHPTV